MTEIALSDLVCTINPTKNPTSGKFQPTTKLSKYINKIPWSPIVFKDQKRKQSNFLYSDWAVLDYDDGQETIEEAINRFCDCVHLIGTTKSHTKDHHRFRVCIPWSERIHSLEKFRFNQSEFVADYDTDQQCKDGARFYYPCKDIVSVSTEGFRVAVKEPPLDKPKEFKHCKTGFSSAVTFFMKNEIDQGRRNIQLYQVSKDLFRIGLDKQVVKQIILASPTYRNKSIPDSLSREIGVTMESAWRSVAHG